MRKTILFLISTSMISLLLYAVPNLHAEEREVEASIQNFFGYLKDGDTQSILSLLTEPILSEQRKLLENNSEYPEFLRKIYKNSYMVIKNTEKINRNKRAIDVEIYHGNLEPPLEIRFILKRKKGLWKISEEITD